jgi:hypothetical protein
MTVRAGVDDTQHLIMLDELSRKGWPIQRRVKVCWKYDIGSFESLVKKVGVRDDRSWGMVEFGKRRRSGSAEHYGDPVIRNQSVQHLYAWVEKFGW